MSSKKFGVVPNFPWDPDLDPPLPWDPSQNPYGFWDGEYGDKEANRAYPNCRLTQPLYLCSLCGDKTQEDPEGFYLYLVWGAHLIIVVAPIYSLWCVFEKAPLLRKRVYSPFILAASFALMPAGSMCEVAQHLLTMNWNSCYDTAVTEMKLYFYFLTSISFSGLTIGLRKVNVPLIRIPKKGNLDLIPFLIDILSFLIDWFVIIGSVGVPIVWIFFGKKATLSTFTFVQIISGVAMAARIYKNLGPSKTLLYLGIAVIAPSAIGPIWINPWLQRSGSALVHTLLGTTFLITEVGVGYCMLFVKEEKQSSSTANPSEETSLLP